MVFLPILNSTQAELTTENEWRLEITGLVNNPLSITLSELQAMPNTNVQAIMYCVDFTGYVVEAGNWTGVKLAYLLQEAGMSPTAIKVAFFAADGYSTDLTIEEATQPDVIIAYEKDGSPVTGTIRMVVPGRWGYKWITSLVRIELVNYDFKGRYESAGYDDVGISQERTDDPLSANPLPVFPIPSQTTNQNTTTIKPTEPTPAPSNSSDTQTTQETQEELQIPQETQKPEDSLTMPIAALILVSAAIVSTTLALHSRKRKH